MLPPAWTGGEIVSDEEIVTLHEILLAAARKHVNDASVAARLAECVLHRVNENPDLLADAAALTDLMQQVVDDLWRKSAPAARPKVD